MRTEKIIRYTSYVICFLAILILLKPAFFYAKGMLINSRLRYEWGESKSNHQINRYNRSIYPIGRIEIKRLGLSSIITAGDLEKGLEVSVAHIPKTSLPGREGNIGLSGHRDTFFKKLKYIKIKDVIELEHLDGLDQYVVYDIEIINPSETNYLHQSNEQILTLITCYPFDYIGKAPQRYMIQALKI